VENKNQLSKILLFVIAAGIWTLVLQNAGVISVEKKKVSIDGEVTVNGRVNATIGNTVDVNIGAINGKRNAFYDHSGDGNFNRLPVYTNN